MSALRELQADFAAAMFSGDETAVAQLLAHCDGPLAGAGVGAYRDSVLSNLAAAVEATYPVVGAIVGTEFLAAAVRRYAREVPSRCADLNAYGDAFDRFLADYPPAASLPYLPDVARLEWAVQQVFVAPDAPPQDMTRLAATPPEAWGELRFRLDPGHALLDSPFPLVRIWEVNQPGYAGDFNVNFATAQHVLVHRRPAGTVVEALTPADYAFVITLKAEATLADAVDAAVAADAVFDLSATLQRHLHSGLLQQAF
jgi:hypothetical protein